MRLQLKRMIGVLMLAAVAAMLVAAMGTSTAGASEFKTSGAFPVTFLGEGLGLSTFLSAELNSVVCHKSHSKGTVFSTTLATVLITYLTGCELTVEKSAIGSFKEPCPTIFTLHLHITPLSKLNGRAGLTGILVQPYTGKTNLAEFTCSGSNKVKVEVSGSVICETSPIGSLGLTGKVICKANAAKHGEQEVTSGEITQTKTTVTAGLTAVSTLSIFKITEKDTQETTEDVTYSAPVEQTE